MNYCAIKRSDVANGPGMRVTLFVSGCTNRCPGCFQPQTWDFCYGRPFTAETEAEIFAELDKSYVDGLTVLGGEPFEPKNQPTLTALLQRVKEAYPNKTVWCFTGFRLEEELLTDGSYPRTDCTDEMLSYIDILVDGRFMLELKDISLQFRGSRNQRIIDMNRTREVGEIVIWEKMRR